MIGADFSLYGGASVGDTDEDVFYFAASSGGDTIGGFEDDLDLIDLSEFDVSFLDLDISNNGSALATVTIAGVDSSDVTIFVQAVDGSVVNLNDVDFVF